MMRIAIILMVILIEGLQAEVRQISGIVTNGDVPLYGAVVSTVDGAIRTTTDIDGRFSMDTNGHDELQFTHPRMFPLKLKLKKGEHAIRAVMQPRVANLPEVTVETKAQTRQRQLALEYPENYNIVKTKFGYLNRDRSVYAMRIVEGDKLFKGAVNFLESLRVFVPQIRIVNGSTVYLRPNNSLRQSKPVVYDLDGQVLFSAPTGLAISEIDRIAVITSASIGAKYGAPAANGLIIINTKGSK